jgi:hypothetical protein
VVAGGEGGQHRADDAVVSRVDHAQRQQHRVGQRHRRRNEKLTGLWSIVRRDLAILGADLASAKQAAVLTDSIVVGGRMFTDDARVIEDVLAWAVPLVVGCEPTGHRWEPLLNRTRARGIELRVVTLYDCLDTFTRLLAPFVPFVTEEVWQRLVRPGNPDAADSVHLADWPAQPQPALLDENLLVQMDAARAVTEAGRSARKASGVRIRQPLARALVGLPAGVTLSTELLDDIAEELNVKQLSPLSATDAVDSR